nr:protein 117 [synthetic construct]
MGGAARVLLAGQEASLKNGPQNSATRVDNGTLDGWFVPYGDCFCYPWYATRGTTVEYDLAYVMNWIAFAISMITLAWYAYEYVVASCGWEEVYVCIIETFNVAFEIFHEFDEPLMLYLSSGVRVPFLRYTEWLMSCPVILIHLSNLSGLKDAYNKRTMVLLVSLIGCLVTGVYCAMIPQGWVKWLMYTVSFAYCAITYWQAARVYAETYIMMPKGGCRRMVAWMAAIFFTCWGIVYPLTFALGPEGLNVISFHLSNFIHCVADLFAKLLWGAMGHHLRFMIAKHILIHGDLRKTTKVKFGNAELEVETFIEADEASEEGA